MKKLILIYFFFQSGICIGQSEQDYYFLNSVINDLTAMSHSDTILLDESVIEFTDQKTFFSMENFTEYTFPTLGVDSKKVKKMLTKLDYAYLANQSHGYDKWEINKFKVKVKYSDKNDKLSLQHQQFSISLPIFTKDNCFAFIYYRSSCGRECGYYTAVNVYKKIRGKWKYYVHFPLTV